MPAPDTLNSLCIRDLGRLAYAPALEIQRQVHQQVRDALAPPTLLLVEHDPVITVTRRPGAAAHLISTPPALAKMGIEVQPTDRGGDITYHGPGQLVAYPILRLADFGLNVSRYMRLLEDVVIDAVATFGVTSVREPGCTGVWVARPSAIANLKSPMADLKSEIRNLTSQIPSPGASAHTAALPPPAPTAKLCALGVRVSRGVTLHGLALNVTTNLEDFKTIVPCGLAGREVTSLQTLLGPKTPSMDQVKAALIHAFHTHLVAATPKNEK